MDLPKVFRELKFLREEHSKEYNEYLKSLEKLDIQLPVIFPKLCTFWSYQGVVLQTMMLRGFYESQKFKAKKSDIFVVSFPKTGTTWVQEAVYLIGSNCDFKKAKSTNLEKRFPLLELTDIDNSKTNDQQRFFKSHLPYSLLPQSVRDSKCKIIYVTRNPKDTLVSMWHFYKMLKLLQYRGTLKQFMEENFITDRITYAPFSRSVLEFWERRMEENIFFITYEELTRDLVTSIRRISEFLGKSFSENDIQKIAYHCSFQKMSANPKVNYSQWKDNGFASKEQTNFMRKGKVGDWKNYLDESMNQKMDEYIERNFKGSGLEFIYEL